MPPAAARVVQYDSKTKTLSPNGGGSLTQFPGNQPGEAVPVPLPAAYTAGSRYISVKTGEVIPRHLPVNDVP